MKLPMHSFKPLLVDMRVNLRRGNVRVPEHFLYDPQIGSVPEQMRRKTVPEQMRVNVLFQPRPLRLFFYNLPDARRG